MRAIFNISFASLLRRPKRTSFLLIGVTLSVTMIVIICAFCLALVEVQYNILWAELSEKRAITGNELHQLILDHPDFALVISICILFVLITCAGAVFSIYGTLSLGLGEKAKTLSALSTLGAKRTHKAALMLLDAIWISIIAIPTGALIGTLAIRPINSTLGAQLARIYGENARIALWSKNPTAFILCIAALCFFTVLVASLRPTARLLKGTSIDIAKSYDAINISLKDTFIDKLMVKLFGFKGRLAASNYCNNKKRYRQFSLSVSASSLVFILFSMLVIYVTDMGADVDSDPEGMRFYLTVISVFMLIFTACFFSACCSLYVNFSRRRGEFAMLMSVGADNKTIYSMVIIEAVYYGLYMIIYIIAGAFISDIALYTVMKAEDPSLGFYFPATEILISCGAVIIITLLLSVFMVSVVKRINIVAELKKNY